MTARFPAAVLWDMDGTLVDTEPHWRDAQRALLARHGLPPLTLAEEAELVGADLEEAARAFIERFGVPLEPAALIAEVGGHVLALTRERLDWRPGARELLARLTAEGIPSALVTNSLRPLADAMVESHGGDPFAAIVTAEEVERAKPSPEPYLLAARRLGVDPADCVVIEDSPYGVEAGLAAGCAVLGVPHGTSLAPSDRYALRATLAGLEPAELGALLERRPDAIHRGAQ